LSFGPFPPKAARRHGSSR
jgi:hypothetical protein